MLSKSIKVTSVALLVFVILSATPTAFADSQWDGDYTAQEVSGTCDPPVEIDTFTVSNREIVNNYGSDAVIASNNRTTLVYNTGTSTMTINYLFYTNNGKTMATGDWSSTTTGQFTGDVTNCSGVIQATGTNLLVLPDQKVLGAFLAILVFAAFLIAILRSILHKKPPKLPPAPIQLPQPTSNPVPPLSPPAAGPIGPISETSTNANKPTTPQQDGRKMVSVYTSTTKHKKHRLPWPELPRRRK